MSITTVTPAELGAFLDAVASAPLTLRDVPRFSGILARLVGLANAKHPIGEIVPALPDEPPIAVKGDAPPQRVACVVSNSRSCG